MAGNRRSNAHKLAARTGQSAADLRRPTQRSQRAARRLAALQQRLRSATTPGEQVGAAADFFRGAVKHAADARRAEAATQEVIRCLIRHGRQLLDPNHHQ